MTNWFPGLEGIIDRGFGGSRGGDSINGAVLHHTANGGGISALDYVANANSRNSHPTYLVQSSGASFGIVHPDRRPFSTAGRPDSEAITFEIDNSAAGPNWPITDEALEEVCQIIAYHYKNSPRFGNGIARNIPGQAQKEFFVAWHSQYKATACPGPYVLSKIDYIIARSLEIAGGGVKPPTTPKPTPAVDTSYKYHMQKGDGLTYQEPDGWVAAQIQRGLANAGVYDTRVNSIDGVWDINTRKGVQRIARRGGYTGPIDGYIGKNTIKGVQNVARNGGYTGPIDGVPGINTWTGFRKYLGQ